MHFTAPRRRGQRRTTAASPSTSRSLSWMSNNAPAGEASIEWIDYLTLGLLPDQTSAVTGPPRAYPDAAGAPGFSRAGERGFFGGGLGCISTVRRGRETDGGDSGQEGCTVQHYHLLWLVLWLAPGLPVCRLGSVRWFTRAQKKNGHACSSRYCVPMPMPSGVVMLCARMLSKAGCWKSTGEFATPTICPGSISTLPISRMASSVARQQRGRGQAAQDAQRFHRQSRVAWSVD